MRRKGVEEREMKTPDLDYNFRVRIAYLRGFIEPWKMSTD